MWWGKKRSPDEISQGIYAVFIRMNSGETSAVDREYFENWKEQNPEALVIYRKIEYLWNELGIHAMNMAPEDIHENLKQTEFNKRHNLSYPKISIAASVILIVSIFLGFQFYSKDSVFSYRTARGERMVISLEDGSNVHLNSLSDVDVLYSDSERTITLNRGEALFEVAHDENRKFFVQTAHGSIQALGTDFNISVESDDIKVTIIDGTVLIKSKQHIDQSVIGEVATVGEQVLIDSHGNLQSTTIENVTTIIAWTKGKLIFSGEPLHQALEKVNLHSKHNIRVKDPRLRNLPLFGIFNTGDTPGFIGAIEEAFPIKSIEVSGSTTLLLYRTDG